MGHILLTALCAFAGGLLLDRLHVPGGMMIGAVIGACILNTVTGIAAMPSTAKTLAQIIAGAFIGSGIRREDVTAMRQIIKPALILLPCLLAVNIAAGYLIYRVYRAGYFNYEEAMLAATPAGASDMALISADLGIHNVQLIVLQVLRLIVVVLVFPMVLNLAASLL